MNKFKKYAENVFVAECEKEHKKDDIIELTTKYGKAVQCIVWNLVGKKNDKFYYSIERLDGTNSKTIAEKKAEKAKMIQHKKLENSDSFYEKSKEGRDFLSLAEPIKIGHHSEKKHRALIDRNHKRMENSVRLKDEAEKYKNLSLYWKNKSKEMNLSMPECLEFYEYELNKAVEYHKGLKDGSIRREHSYSLQYARKKVTDLKRKVDIANKLWGVK